MRAPDEKPQRWDNDWIVWAAMIAFGVLAALVLAGSLLAVR